MLAVWLYAHPRCRRIWVLFQVIWGWSLAALLTAPQAAADSVGEAMSWTGLHDSYNIPVGAHIVSTVPWLEAVREAGPSIGTDPISWAAAKTGTAVTYLGLADVLAAESAVLAFAVAVGVWFIKFALGMVWVGWLGTLARPILAHISALVGQMGLVPGAFMICAAIGGVTAATRGVGRGLGIIFGGGLVIALSAFLLRDPAGEVTGDNGLLGIGRWLGFSFSEGLVNHGPLAPGGTAAQIDRLTSWLVDVLDRQQIEVINFGRVIDDNPVCVDAYNRALTSTGEQEGLAAHALAKCAPDALSHAQHLGAATAGLFALLIPVIVVVLAAADYIGAECFKCGFKAFWRLLVIVPAWPFAVPPGPPREFVKRTGLKFVLHAVEMAVATAAMGILILIMADLTRGTVAASIGMDHPVAKLFVMLVLGVFGAVGFRAMLRGFGDRGIPGPLRMIRAVRSGAGRAATAEKDLKRTRKLGERVVARGNRQGGSGTGGDSGPNAPGRKAHPQPAAGRRPPSAPSSQTQTRPGPAGPGRTDGQGGASTQNGPAGRSPVTSGVSAAATSTAARTVPAAAGAAAAANVAGRVVRGPERREDDHRKPGRGEKPPSAAPSQGSAPGRSGSRGGSGTASGQARPQRDVADNLPARSDPPAPGRSAPTPTDEQPHPDDPGPEPPPADEA